MELEKHSKWVNLLFVVGETESSPEEQSETAIVRIHREDSTYPTEIHLSVVLNHQPHQNLMSSFSNRFILFLLLLSLLVSLICETTNTSILQTGYFQLFLQLPIETISDISTRHIRHIIYPTLKILSTISTLHSFIPPLDFLFPVISAFNLFIFQLHFTHLGFWL